MKGTQLITRDDWIIQARIPNTPGPHPVYFLIHGWTGDENSMWIFAPKLPKSAILVAPRGIHQAPLGGYSWHPRQDRIWPTLQDLLPAVERLNSLRSLEIFPTADLSKLNLVGFSQGAALIFAYLLTYPKNVNCAAGLSGFLPENLDGHLLHGALQDKQVFIAHGSLDKLVPIERARQAVETLEKASARVVFCEDKVGHKLSASCFRGLEAFFSGDRNC